MPEEPVIFVDDIDGYRQWIFAHMTGYVINADRSLRGGPLVLHEASCDTIAPLPDRQRDYAKICAEERLTLDIWAHERFGVFPTTDCPDCKP